MQSCFTFLASERERSGFVVDTDAATLASGRWHMILIFRYLKRRSTIPVAV